jgi:hypothetical protein
MSENIAERALRNIRKWQEAWIAGEAVGTPQQFEDVLANTYHLDQWLRDGGELPDAWKRRP